MTVSATLPLLLLLLFVHAASAANHTLEYVFTATCGVNGSRKVVGTSLVDGAQIGRYDNSSWKSEAQLAWMEGLSAEGPPFWEHQTQLQLNYLTDIMDSAKQQFNCNAENHIVQLMVSCTLDNKTEKVEGTQKYSYNGRDFIYFDLEKQTWNTRRREAHVIRFRWNWNSAVIKLTHDFLTQICPQWLKDNWDSLDHTVCATLRKIFMKFQASNKKSDSILSRGSDMSSGSNDHTPVKLGEASSSSGSSGTSPGSDDPGVEESETPLMEGEGATARSQSDVRKRTSYERISQNKLNGDRHFVVENM